MGAEATSPEDQLAGDRLGLLIEASRILASGLDATAATQAILWGSVPVLADGCYFDLIGARGEVERAWSTRGGAETRPGHASLLPPSEGGDHPVAVVVRSRQTQVRDLSGNARSVVRSLPPLLRALTSLVAVPLLIRDEVVGVLTFCFSESLRRHTADDVLVAEDLARRISLAMENVRLRRRAGQAAGALLSERAHLDALLRSQEILIEAGTLSASSFDYDATLRRIVEMTVPRLADYCFIHIPDAGGTLRRVAERYRDPNPLVDFKAPLKLPPASPIMRVMRTGASVWLKQVGDDDLVSWAQSDEHLAALRGSGPHSLVCVPLVTHGRLLGTMVFAFNTSSRSYDEAGLDLAEQLAQRAAWALDTALLHKAAEEAKRESERARAEAERSGALKDFLLASLARELGTPLAAAQLWEGILATASNDELRSPTLDAIRANPSAQDRVVDDLLDVSRCLSGGLKVERLPVDIGALVGAAVELARPQALLRRIGLRAELDGEQLVRGDPFRLGQVVDALLSNAFASTEAGDTIVARVRRCAEGVDIVADNDGRGIAVERLAEVFSPFFRRAGPAPNGANGLDLGLAIAQQLVFLHGGTIQAASPGLGRGSTIAVTLPLSSPPNPTPDPE